MDEPDDSRSLENVQKAQEPPNPGVGGGLHRDKLPDVLHPPQVGAGDLEVGRVCAKGTAECGCLLRQSPPARPSHLPFICSAENIDKMKEWLIDRYAASTFNKCTH